MLPPATEFRRDRVLSTRQRPDDAAAGTTKGSPQSPRKTVLLDCSGKRPYAEMMSLINCPECSGEISDRALACPCCGNPMRETLPNGDLPQYRVSVGVGDGVKLGIGMFIVLPVIIAIIYGILTVMGVAIMPR